MILAAGLSPAWQQIMTLAELRIGEVNRARDVQWCASGKVLNVGLALHRLARAAADLPEQDCKLQIENCKLQIENEPLQP